MKKIVHIIISGSWAGSEAAAFAIANAQASHNEIYVVVKEGKQIRAKDYKNKLYNNVNLISFEENDSLSKIIEKLPLLLPEDIEIIHTHLGAGTYIGVNIKQYLKKSKVVAHMHIRYYEEQFKLTDGLIAVSKWQERDIPTSYRGISATVRNFVSPKKNSLTHDELISQRNRFFITKNDYIFGIICRLHIEKGVDVAIRAMKLINNQNIKLIIFGTGEELENLKLLSMNDSRIHFGGFVNGGYPYMKIFNTYISPSRCESFGISQIEAYFNEKNVIASKTYGSLDIFKNGINNNLFEIDNEYELAELMLSAKNKNIQCNIDTNVYSTEYNLPILEDFYDKVLNLNTHEDHRND